jgi:histone H3/H4
MEVVMANSKTEVLVVTSKVKAYIKKKGGLNTSASTIEALSDKVREICDNAIQNAKNDGRKTVKDRDV